MRQVTRGDDMADLISAATTPDSGSRRWAFAVSICLWLFAAWQVFLLPPVVTAFKSFGIQSPGWADLMGRIPPWLLLAVGVSLTVAALALRNRAARTGIIAVSLLAALSAHGANAAL